MLSGSNEMMLRTSSYTSEQGRLAYLLVTVADGVRPKPVLTLTLFGRAVLTMRQDSLVTQHGRCDVVGAQGFHSSLMRLG